MNLDGDFTTSLCFSRGYQILDNLTNCSGANPVHNCKGTDAILTQNTVNGNGYAVAGSYADCIFFSTLDLGGFPTPGSLVRWGKPGDSFGKPILIESLTSAGWFYLCAPLFNGTFIAKVNNAGTVAFANVYSGIMMLNPRSMLHSPFHQNELVVVGLGADPVAAADEGFLMRVDTAGSLISTTLYGDGVSGDEWFNTIHYGFSVPGGGYIVGGHQFSQQLFNNNNQVWALKMDVNGNVLWNKLIQPNTPGKCIEATDVHERWNNPNWEYYFSGGCSTANADNLAVWKMDVNGNNSSFPNTEFVYAIGSGNNLFSHPMSTQLDEAAGSLAAWTTDFTNGDYRFEKAYFNGVNGCDHPWINKLSPGMLVQYNITTVSSAPYVSSCSPSPTNFQLISTVLSPVPNSCWNPGPVPGGSNARSMEATGIPGPIANTESTGVYPNPTTDKITVAFNAEDNMVVKIDLRNTLGQVIKTISINRKAAGNYSEEIDMESMHLSSGIYFVDVIAGHNTTTHKVVYQSRQ